jgi:pyruvate/2-oxoglutarate dehydrogenase complex dihydrolipoamide acyltransferase (E2) component
MDFLTWLRSVLGIEDPAAIAPCQLAALRRHHEQHAAAGRAAPPIYFRDALLTVTRKAGEPETSRLREIIISTDAPVRFGQYREILSHAPGAIDTATLRAVLLNHDPHRMIGAVRALRVEGGRLVGEIELYAEARSESGVPVERLVDDGALRGVSVGYTYGPSDADYDEDARLLTVRHWRALEASLTPIPADPDAHVARSLPTTKPNTPSQRNHAMKRSFKEWLSQRGLSINHANYEDLANQFRAACAAEKAEALIDVERPAPAPAPAPATPPPGDEAARAAELAKLRLQSQVRDLADSHGIAISAEQRSAITDWDSGRALVLKLVAERDAKLAGGTLPAPIGRVHINRDVGDKIRGAAEAGLLRLGGFDKPTEDTPAHVREQWRTPMQSIHTICRHALVEQGHSDALTWERNQIAAWVMEQIPAVKRMAMQIGMGQRSAANHDSGMFTYLLASALTKTLQKGFEDGAGVTFRQWVNQLQVPDFKTNKHTGLAVGNLQSTAENHSFPELTMEDAGYDSTLAMWGGTISLTFQAVVGDDLGAFMRQVARAGAIALRTMDKEVYRALMNATWTYDLTTSAGLGTAGNLDKTRGALLKKTDPAGNPMGITAAFLLHAVANRQKAMQDCGILIAPGQTILAANSILPIESVWVDDANLLGGVANTDYYLVGDPRVFDTVVVETLLGLSGPIVEAYDAGAVAAEKFKIMHPFAATVATHSDGTNTRVSGAQKATA